MYLMCRLCFEDEGILEKIFDIEKSLFSTINDYLFKLPDIDGWPTGICESCKLKLVITTDFFKTCRKTNQLLLEQMQETMAGDTEHLLEMEVSSDENNINEIEENPDAINQVESDEVSEHFFIENSSGENSLLKELITNNENNLEPTNRDHPVATPYKCAECERTFQFKAGLANHMRTHSRQTFENDRQFECKFCERKFKSKAHLSNHMRGHFKKNAESLRKSALAIHENCETSEEEFDSYLETNNKINDSVENLFQCTGCIRKFKAKAHLSNHMRRHFNEKTENRKENEKQFQCTECDRAFKFKGNLGNHMRSHSNKNAENHKENEKQFQCTECDRAYKFKAHLLNHMRRHFNENVENVYSETSDVEFDSSLETNNKINDSVEYRFQCTDCIRKFKTKAHLSNHMRRHFNENPENHKENENKFLCKECDRAFKFKGNLGNHMRSHSNKNAENVYSETSDVEFEFSLETNELPNDLAEFGSTLETNNEINDSVENRFQCTDCVRKFKTKAHLSNHMRRHFHHQFQCTECDRTFKSKAHVSNHMRRHFNENTENVYSETSDVEFEFSLETNELPNDKENDLAEVDSSLERNNKINDSVENLFQCTECIRKFKTKAHLSNHMRRHFNENPENLKENKNQFQCTECDRTFKFKGGLGNHMRGHSNKNAQNIRKLILANNPDMNASAENPFQCTECDKTFKFKCNLGNHIRTHSNNNSENIRKSILATNPDINASKDIGTSLEKLTNCDESSMESPFGCTDCDTTFTTKGNLENHMLSHSRKNVETSNQSTRDSDSSDNYSEDLTPKPKRMKIIDTHNVFQCSVCKIVLKTKLSLQNHAVTHSEDERPFKCDICKSSFELLTALHQHKDMHNNFRIDCGKSFITKMEFLNHQY